MNRALRFAAARVGEVLAPTVSEESGDFPRALATVARALQPAQAQNKQALIPGLDRVRRFYEAGRPHRDGG